MQLELSENKAQVSDENQNIVSKTEYARHRECSQANISKYLKSGKITAPAILPDGRINIVLADEQLARNLDPQRIITGPDDQDNAPSLPGAEDGNPSFSVERARSESFRSQKLEIELARLKGELVLSDDVSRAAEANARSVRDKFMNMIPDLVIKLGLSNEREGELIMRQAFIKAFTEVHADIETGLLASRGTVEEETTDDGEW